MSSSRAKGLIVLVRNLLSSGVRNRIQLGMIYGVSLKPQLHCSVQICKALLIATMGRSVSLMYVIVQILTLTVLHFCWSSGAELLGHACIS